MAQKVYKNPVELSKNINQVPPFNKEAIVHYLKNYGSGFDDDNYEQWATKKGKELKKFPLNPNFVGTDYHKQWYGKGHDYTYAPQYLEDDEWLKEVWNDVYEDALDYYGYDEDYGDIDADYERSYGPVDSREKYQAYLKWKKEGK